MTVQELAAMGVRLGRTQALIAGAGRDDVPWTEIDEVLRDCAALIVWASWAKQTYESIPETYAEYVAQGEARTPRGDGGLGQ